jgi:hypothetical protein
MRATGVTSAVLLASVVLLSLCVVWSIIQG